MRYVAILRSQKEVPWVVWIKAPRCAHCAYWCTHFQVPLTCVKHPLVLVVSKVSHVTVVVRMRGKCLARLLKGDTEKSVEGRNRNYREILWCGSYVVLYSRRFSTVNIFVACYGKRRIITESQKLAI